MKTFDLVILFTLETNDKFLVVSVHAQCSIFPFSWLSGMLQIEHSMEKRETLKKKDTKQLPWKHPKQWLMGWLNKVKTLATQVSTYSIKEAGDVLGSREYLIAAGSVPKKAFFKKKKNNFHF